MSSRFAHKFGVRDIEDSVYRFYREHWWDCVDDKVVKLSLAWQEIGDPSQKALVVESCSSINSGSSHPETSVRIRQRHLGHTRSLYSLDPICCPLVSRAAIAYKNQAISYEALLSHGGVSKPQISFRPTTMINFLPRNRSFSESLREAKCWGEKLKEKAIKNKTASNGLPPLLRGLEHEREFIAR